MMIILAVLAICAVTSTKQTRAAGLAAVQPFARAATWIVVAVWLAILFLPHGK